MKNRIVVIALDLSFSDDQFVHYNQLSTMEKINELSVKIKYLCTTLSKIYPQDAWIITWREYGITSSASRYITPTDKTYLKEKMIELTKSYEQLTIIAGSVATVKQYDQNFETKIQQARNYFTTFPLSSNDKVINDWHILQIENIREKIKNNELTSLNVLRNTCYIFTNKDCLTCVDKRNPFYETVYAIEWWKNAAPRVGMKDTIFQPGNKTNLSSIINLKHPSGEKFPISIEICRDHHAGRAINDSQRLEGIPLIQLVLSNKMRVYIDHIVANHYVLIDDNILPQLITKVPNSNFEVMLYHSNCLQTPNLQGPHKPIIPIEFKLLSELKNIKAIVDESSLPTKFSLLDILNKLYTLFCDGIKLDIPLNKLTTSIQIKQDFINLLDENNDLHVSILKNKLLDLFVLLESCQSRLNPVRIGNKK